MPESSLTEPLAWPTLGLVMMLFKADKRHRRIKTCLTVQYNNPVRRGKVWRKRITCDIPSTETMTCTALGLWGGLMKFNWRLILLLSSNLILGSNLDL